MAQKRQTGLKGFTLVELMITMVVMIIVASAIGVVLIDNQRGWSNMYGRINSDVTTDGFVARKKFDAVVRNSSSEKISVDPVGTWIELYYYASSASTVVDRYVRFYEADGDLNVEYGTLGPKVTLSVKTICSNVSACTFKQVGRSAQMILTLDNGTQTNTVVTSAVTQN
jgi:Tfp pilus assembly protein FimT